MKRQLLLVALVALVASSAQGQIRWQNLVGQQDSVVQRYDLSNPVTHRDTIWSGNTIIRIDTSTSYDSAAFNVTIGTHTALSEYGVIELSVLPTGVVLAATTAGILRSTDQGTNWTLSNSGIAPDPQSGRVIATTLSLGPGGALYAGALYGFYRSTDEGVHWTALPHAAITGGARTIRYSSSSDLYVLDNGDNSWKTTDVGNTWSFIRSGGWPDGFGLFEVSHHGGLFGSCIGGLFKYNGTPHRWSNVIANERYVIFGIGAGGHIVGASDLGQTNHFKGSIDDGATWSNFGTWTKSNQNIRALGVNPSGHVMFSGMARDSVHQYYYPYASYAKYGNTVVKDASTGLYAQLTCFAFDSTGHVYGGSESGGIYRTALALPIVTSASVPPASHSANEVVASPNPCQTTVRVQLPEAAPGQATPGQMEMHVWNSIGGEVLHRVIEPRSSIAIDVNDLPNGCYTAMLRGGNDTHTFRFLVAH